MTSLDEIIPWYLVSTLVSLAFAPAVLTLFRRFTDRGASLTRPLSALLLVWPAWFGAGLGSGLVPFAPVTLWATIAIGGALSWMGGIRSGALDGTTIRHLLIAEAGFLVAFAAFTWFHGYGPQLMDQEKLSDLMMLSSTMRAEQMPPNDAWFAGESINYYYVGYVVWAGLGKLIDTTPAIAFNLALSSVFATTVVTAAGLAGNVLGRWASVRLARIGGMLAAVFLLGGNPWGVFRILGDPARWWDTGFNDFAWASTRIIDRESNYTAITELPAFSFALADLHPHLLALPYTLTALACAWLLATAPAGEERSVRAWWPALALTGWVVGALYAMNSWDYPTYLAIALAAVLVGMRRQRWRDRLAAGAVVLVASIALWFPFHAAFEAPERSSESAFAGAVESIPVIGGILASLAGVTGERTPIGDYVAIFGFTYAIALLLIGMAWWRRQDRPQDPAMLGAGIVTALVLILGGLLVPMPLLVLCGLPLVAIALLLGRDTSPAAANSHRHSERSEESPSEAGPHSGNNVGETRFARGSFAALRMTSDGATALANVALVLFGVAFALTLVPEFVFLLDIFGARMNTIFKLYYQAWTLAAIGAVIGLAAIWQAVRQWRPGRVIMPALTAALALMLLTYPVVVGKQWLDWRNPDRDWLGMDGIAAIPAIGDDERASLEWLWENAEADDVMLAAGGCEWSNAVGRTASATGVPTLLGWPGHEEQWRLGHTWISNEILERAEDIEALGESLHSTRVDDYGITLLYLGPAEMEGANVNARDDCVPGPFRGASDPSYPGDGWSEVFSQGEVRIFRKDGT